LDELDVMFFESVEYEVFLFVYECSLLVVLVGSRRCLEVHGVLDDWVGYVVLVVVVVIELGIDDCDDLDFGFA